MGGPDWTGESSLQIYVWATAWSLEIQYQRAPKAIASHFLQGKVDVDHHP